MIEANVFAIIIPFSILFALTIIGWNKWRLKGKYHGSSSKELDRENRNILFWIGLAIITVVIVFLFSFKFTDRETKKVVGPAIKLMSPQGEDALKENYKSARIFNIGPLVFNPSDGRKYAAKYNGRGLISMNNVIEKQLCRNCDRLKEVLTNNPKFQTIHKLDGKKIYDVIYIYEATKENDSVDIFYSIGKDVYLDALLKFDEKKK